MNGYSTEPEPCKHCTDRIARPATGFGYVHIEGNQMGMLTCAVNPYGFHAEPVGTPCGDHPANPCIGSRGATPKQVVMHPKVGDIMTCPGCGEEVTLDWADGWRNDNGLTCNPVSTTHSHHIITVTTAFTS